MTTHYKATLDGVTVTRSTLNRTYTHVVIGFTNIANARKAAADGARSGFTMHRAFYQDMVSGKRKAHIIEAIGFNPSRGMIDAEGKVTAAYLNYVKDQKTQHAAAVEDARKWLALGPEGHVAERLAAFDQYHATATNISSDGKYFLCDCGWSSSYALAAKNAAKVSKYHQRVEIVEAEQVNKPAKPSVSKATK